MRVLVGTSGYSYAPWKGRFYPPKLPAAQMLSFYAGRFATVEINNTFYRMPAAEMLTKWTGEVPAAFTFALKSPKRITHEKRLVDCEDPLRHFFATAGALGERLGPILFQLPPFSKQDLPKLEAFLSTLRAIAPAARPAFEFRHESWFTPGLYELLRAHGAALCIAEAEDFATPLEVTAGWGYLRLRREDYDDAALARWAERVAAQPWQDVYVYFKHEDEAKGPALAQQFVGLMGAG